MFREENEGGGRNPQPTEGMRMEEASQKGPSLVLRKVKGREGKSAFRLARFCFCDNIIKAVLTLVVLVFCLDYPEELTTR